MTSPDTIEFLSRLRRLDIRVWATDGQLRVNAPDGTLTPKLHAELKTRKAEIMAFLGATGDSTSLALGLRPIPRTGVLPLSFAQQRLWFLDQLEGPSATYTISMALRLNGPLQPVVLEQALSEVVRRHESLRTTFVSAEGRPLQVIAPPGPFELAVVDLAGCSPAEQGEEIQRLAAQEAQWPFDLRVGPLVRATLLQLNAEQTEHILLLSLHHIVADEWSLGILKRELSVLYTTLAQGQPSPLPELAIQYADFAAWQRTWLQGEVLQNQLAYWRRQLDGIPSILELPIDHPRPLARTFHGERVFGLSSAKITASLKLLSQQEDATLFMTLLAAFQVVLSRISGQEDIPIGSPVAGRTEAEVEGLIGLFVNNLVMRSDLSGNPTFRELLKRVRIVVLGAYEHQDLPFEKIMEDSHPKRSLDHTPLFQVMFNMRGFEQAQLEMLNLDVEVLTPPETGAKVDMTLQWIERKNQIEWMLVYNADLFDHDRIKELLHQYEYLLEQIAENPDHNIGAFSLVTPGAHQILPDPTRVLAETVYPSVPTMFADIVSQMPAQPAVCQGGHTWTYAQLETDARALVGCLQTQGIQRQQVVAITGPRSYKFVAGMLAVLMNGGILLTLDQRLPILRQQFMIRKAGCQHVIDVGESSLEGAGQWDSIAKVIHWQDAQAILSSDQVVLPDIFPDDLAYIFFTSGTTGVPKGILGDHRGLSHFLTWQRNQFEVGPADRSAQLTGLSFDVVLRDVFLPLTSGATLCLPDDPDDLGADLMLPWMDCERITLLHTVPTLAQTWLMRRPEDVILSSLRQIFFAGEPLTGTLVSQWRFSFPKSGQIANFYGPTETTLAKCYYQVPEGNLAGVQPIGWPLPSTQVLILADRHQLCGIGEPGEIVIRTPFRSLGYINPAQTDQQCFAPNPFRPHDDQDLVYYTGDRGRYRPDGSVEILGRLDDQVKVRGMRVEPDEVNAVLIQQPAVLGAVVLAREDTLGDKRLVAYVVPQPGQTLTASELRVHLQAALPEYMLPGAFVFLAALPLTPNGKVDRHALPAPDYRSAPEGYQPPRTPVEDVLAALWAEVLGVEQVGGQDNFFELGGHSLLATQVVSRVRRAFQVELSVRSVFEAPSLAAFARRVEAVRQAGPGLAGPPLRPLVWETTERPVSFAQQRLWFLDQLEPGLTTYNLTTALRLTGQLNVMALEESLNEIIRRHEVLGASFRVVDEQSVQVIIASSVFELPVIDLSSLSNAKQETETQHLVMDEAQRPFDLGVGPLVRATLLQLNAEQTEHILLLSLHHIVADEWSLGILKRELSVLYTALAQGQPSPLPELAIQYADFAAWQRTWLQGEVLDRQVRYWQVQLAGAPALLELPTDHPRPPVQTYQGSSLSFELAASLTQSLKALSRQADASLFMTLYAAVVTVLARTSGQTDVVVGVPIANRTQEEVEPLIGFFVNTLALRADVSGDPPFTELLQRVRRLTLDAYAHQEVPFEKLVEELQPTRSLSYHPLFQVLFAWQNAPGGQVELPGVRSVALALESGSAKFDLSLFLWEQDRRLVGRVEYNTALFERESMERLVGHLQVMLAGIVADPAQKVSSLPLLTAAEQQQLLGEWNATQREYPHEQCLPELFEAQVARAPEAVAVVFEDEQLTYGALNARANQLARVLQQRGVGPEVLVGLCLEGRWFWLRPILLVPILWL